MFADALFLWEWEYDEDFIRILDRKCNQFGLQSYLIHPYHLPEVQHQMEKGNFAARIFYDRASDNNLAFEPFVRNLVSAGSNPLNDPARLEFALDKAVMHHELQQHGVDVPYTIIMTPHRDWMKLKIGELIRLGEPFIIKPALGGGGVGVEVNAKTLFDIVKAREEKGKEKFLLQEKILPAQLGGRRAWFRVYWVCGESICCWWDDLTHVYYRVTPEEEQIYALKRLKTTVAKLAEITRVNFFSTEIAIVDRERLVVVDYVNDQCDMRLKSRHADGVPDDVVEEVAYYIAGYVQKKISLLPRVLRITERSII